jgi:hypothetical protein
MATKMRLSGCFISTIILLGYLGSLFQWNPEKLDRIKISGKLIFVSEHQFQLFFKGQGSAVVALGMDYGASYPDLMYTLASLLRRDGR